MQGRKQLHIVFIKRTTVVRKTKAIVVREFFSDPFFNRDGMGIPSSIISKIGPIVLKGIEEFLPTSVCIPNLSGVISGGIASKLPLSSSGTAPA